MRVRRRRLLRVRGVAAVRLLPVLRPSRAPAAAAVRAPGPVPVLLLLLLLLLRVRQVLLGRGGLLLLVLVVHVWLLLLLHVAASGLLVRGPLLLPVGLLLLLRVAPAGGLPWVARGRAVRALLLPPVGGLLLLLRGVHVRVLLLLLAVVRLLLLLAVHAAGAGAVGHGGPGGCQARHGGAAVAVAGALEEVRGPAFVGVHRRCLQEMFGGLKATGPHVAVRLPTPRTHMACSVPACLADCSCCSHLRCISLLIPSSLRSFCISCSARCGQETGDGAEPGGSQVQASAVRGERSSLWARSSGTREARSSLPAITGLAQG